MRDKLVMGALLLTLVTMTSTAVAAPSGSFGWLGQLGSHRTLVLPATADHSPVITLGTAVDLTTGQTVDGYAIVHYAKGGNGGGKPGSGGGYALMGAKWKTVEPWLLNPVNTGGLPYDPPGGFGNNNSTPGSSFAFWNTSYDIDKWEDAADGVMGNGSGTDILGDGTETFSTLTADLVAPDGLNEVYFADVSESGAIAVTIVWGIFSGPPQNRQLVEWDQVYDDVDYDWSTFGEASKMDFENIATHELGHSVGLADLYSPADLEQTMYGYADFGETKKQTLESGDIAGTDKLY
ncbi:hypothetical protein A3K24_02970 [candidate division Kazan bacterium RIFCSPHIGHO2_01_FULL_44_14]|uniref:Peptidase M10 metallopeptidase domain-containing protein n=1 Tax=candidate division Kazan bacterium RIFCSPLOWO2_01_FULL_45_19 TaxID=1798538 RepID=A0A1F4NQL7_UNCK3|nr:MAG: hypothetical protein A3K51_02970 [candidate division Kazan bacterium RIFCSPLOWO2_01_FULL_45_19]OGB78010.1 MAG: hypothetical protein A3K24_02970 [candidate division Kazan bacterium RIFCSPHIGHO2_01_FULL_44_14]